MKFNFKKNREDRESTRNGAQVKMDFRKVSKNVESLENHVAFMFY